MTNSGEKPLGCASRNDCLADAFQAKARAQEINELKQKIEHLEIRLAEHETSLAFRTQSAELARAYEVRLAMQKIEAGQRRTIDVLEETCTILRQIMQTNGMDLEAVRAIVEDRVGRRHDRQDGEEPAERPTGWYGGWSPDPAVGA